MSDFDFLGEPERDPDEAQYVAMADALLSGDIKPAELEGADDSGYELTFTTKASDDSLLLNTVPLHGPRNSTEAASVMMSFLSIGGLKHDPFMRRMPLTFAVQLNGPDGPIGGIEEHVIEASDPQTQTAVDQAVKLASFCRDFLGARGYEEVPVRVIMSDRPVGQDDYVAEES